MNMDLLVRDLSVGSEESIPVWGGPCSAARNFAMSPSGEHRQETHILGVAMMNRG